MSGRNRSGVSEVYSRLSAQRQVGKPIFGAEHLGEALFCMDNRKYYVHARGADVHILTQSAFIKDYCRIHYDDNLEIEAELPNYAGTTVWVSGYAPCLSEDTLRGALAQFESIDQDEWAVVSAVNVKIYSHMHEIIPVYSGMKLEEINAFTIYKGNGDRKTYLYPVTPKEMVVVNSVNDFELALVLKKKQESVTILEKMIEKNIANKRGGMSHSCVEKSICLVGHSQMDQWDISELGGYKVRNCGVSGISSFAYEEKILRKNMLNCDADAFIVMHGTNDVVYDYTLTDIAQSIKKNVDYIIMHNEQAPILFLSCAHVNGRLDRNNALIDQLNEKLRKELGSSVEWVDMSFWDDKYSRLAEEYTKDGLHFSEKGYAVLKDVVERKIKDLGL